MGTFLKKLTLSAVLSMCATVGTAVVTNGFFDADMNEWLSEGVVAWDSDGIAGGSALLKGDSQAPLSSLTQTFFVEADSVYLSFMLMGYIYDSHETEHFTASLGGTELYRWSSSEGTQFVASDVTVDEVTRFREDGLGWTVYTVTASVPVGLLGGYGTLLFELEHDYFSNLHGGLMYIDNVQLIANSPHVIPAPAAVLSALTGLGSLIGLSRFRRKPL